MGRKKMSAPEEALDSAIEPIVDAKELRDSAMRSLRRILELAESDSTETKLKYEIYKWICEMHFGKPSSSSHHTESGEQTLTLSFEGELEKWSS